MTEETLVSKLTPLAKVFPLVKPKEEALPCIVYQRVSTQEGRTHTGKGLNQARFQISCLAETLNEAKELADEAKTALDLNNTDFIMSYLNNEYQDFFQEENIKRILLEFIIFEN